MMRVEFLYFEQCPSHTEALARLRRALEAEELAVDVEVTRVESQQEAERLGFSGSPTIRIDGEDLQPEGASGPPALTCRTYRTGDGRLSPLPTEAMFREFVGSHARRARGGR